MSLPSPTLQTKKSSPAPRSAVSAPVPPETKSLPGLPMRRSAAARREREVDLHIGHVGSRQVVDHNGVSAAECLEVDRLGIVENHGDVGDVAGEEHEPADGRDVDVLGYVRAEEQERVDAVSTHDDVAAVARIPLEYVVAGTEHGDVVAIITQDEVVAVAAEDHVRPLAAENGVVPGAAVDREFHDTGRQRRGGDAVVTAESADDERVVRAFRVQDVHLRGEAEDRNRSSGSDHVDDVVAVRPVGHDRIGRAVAGRRPADRTGEVDVHRHQIGPGQVIDSDRVSIAERVEVDALHIVEIHDDIAEVTGEAHPAPIGRDLENLRPGTAIEEEGVSAVPTLDDVAAVPRIPLEYVVAGAEEGNVIALSASNEIVAVAAEERVAAVAADDRVVARTAVDNQVGKG